MERQLLSSYLKLSEDPKLLENEKLRRAFFKHPGYQHFFCLSYGEFLLIWGQDYPVDLFPERVTKWLIYANIEWYNMIYNENWALKWYPLLFTFAYNCCRRQPTSIILSFVYIASVDYLFDRFMLFKHMDDRTIFINRLFDYNLSKRQCRFQSSYRFFDRYKLVIQNSLRTKQVEQEYEPDRKQYVVAGQRLNIYDPLFEWGAEEDPEKEERRKEFFMQHNQAILFYERVKFGFTHVWRHMKSERGRNILKHSSKQFLKKHVYTIPQSIKTQIKLFPTYKRQLNEIPNRSTYISLLQHPEVNQNKVFNKWDECVLSFSKVINTVKYFVSGEMQFRMHRLTLRKQNIHDTVPQFSNQYISNVGVESCYYDFLIFGAIFLLPAKAAFARKQIRATLHGLKTQMNSYRRYEGSGIKLQNK